MRKLKVYGYAGFVSGVPGRQQQRVIIAAHSLAEARRIVDANPRVGWPGRDYIGVTGNAEELVRATEPGDVFARPLWPGDGREWTRLG